MGLVCKEREWSSRDIWRGRIICGDASIRQCGSIPGPGASSCSRSLSFPDRIHRTLSGRRRIWIRSLPEARHCRRRTPSCSRARGQRLLPMVLPGLLARRIEFQQITVRKRSSSRRFHKMPTSIRGYFRWRSNFLCPTTKIRRPPSPPQRIYRLHR